MNVYPFPALATAQAFSGYIDAHLGIPNAGTPIGGGTHCPGPTLRYGDILPHPTLALWGYPSTAVVDGMAPAAGTALAIGIPAPVPADVSWGVLSVSTLQSQGVP